MRKLGDLKVPELHDELAKVGLSKKGKKAELVERLTEYIREQGSEPDEIDFDVADVLVDMKNSSGAMESEAETKTTINQIEDVDNGDARGGGEVVEAKEFVLTKPDSKDEQREDDEVQVIHQTDEPIPEDEKLKIEEMYPTSEPMDGFDGPIMINSSQSSQESNNTTITSTDEGEESMEIETKVPDIDVQAEKPTSRKASDNETEEVVAEKEKLQAEEPKAKESTEKEPEVPQEEKKDGDSPEHSSKEIQPKEPVEMEVKTTHSDPGTVLLTGFSGQRQVNYWGTQVPPIRSDTESSGFQSEARPLTPDPSENSGDDGDDEWAIDENNNCYDDSADYRNASSEESSDCESTASEDEILERINYMEAENMEPFLSSTSINFYRENHNIKRDNINAWGMIEDELDRCILWAEQFSEDEEEMSAEDIVQIFYSRRQMKDKELKDAHIQKLNRSFAHNEELRKRKAIEEEQKLQEQERIDEQERIEEQERIQEKEREEEEQRLKKERRYRRCKRKLEF